MEDLNVIAGFGFTGYRSFWGPERQLIGPMEKVHLVAGPNNSGKSNILRFASRILPEQTRQEALSSWFEAGSLDQPVGGNFDGTFRISLALRPTEETARHLVSKWSGDERYVEALVHFLGLEAFQRNETGLAWFDYQCDVNGAIALEQSPQLDAAAGQYQVHDPGTGYTERIDLGSLTRLGGQDAGPFNSPQPQTFQFVNRLSVPGFLPQVEFIDAMREVRQGDSNVFSHSGENLIIRLAELQNPSNQNPEQLKKFEEINRFVQTVLEDDTARIHIPYTHDKILIRSHGRVLPLEHLGTGVHEVVILAAAATVLEKRLVCIEEPEVHLHPILQRRLIRYLREFTSNRYLIATHSAHILDTNLASISQVSLEEEGTVVAPAVTPHQLADISSKLGYRASDIVQSNCVIWVEGPTDRLYIRHWISLLDQDLLDRELVEGIHYTIMFYGGSVLSHLATDDPDEEAVNEFISLRRLNRHLAVVMDSDKKSEAEDLNTTKKRILGELLDDPACPTWVTAGYTIENYIPVELFEKAIRKTYPDATSKWAGDQYQNPLADELHTGKPVRFVKAKVAETVIEAWEPGQPWPYDLKEKIAALIEFIGHANGFIPNS